MHAFHGISATADGVAGPVESGAKHLSAAISGPLVDAGFDDVPRNGVFVIGAISRTRAPLSEVIRWLGVSKQSAGQLVDALVVRGYLERSVDEEDRRRLTVQLTSRGRAVAAIARAAVDRIDKRLHERVGTPDWHTRAPPC